MRKRILLFEPSLAEQAFFRNALEIENIDGELIIAGTLTETMAYLSGSEYFKDRESFPLPDFCFVTVKDAEPVGFHLLDWIRADRILQRMKVIACVDAHDPQAVRRAWDLPFDGLLLKPFTPREILHAFEQARQPLSQPLEDLQN
jgi:CheY-like chemotaxis protein